MKKSKKQKNIQLVVIILAILLSFFAWDTIVIYPVKLFVVLLHEISHGIAAVFTGGSIDSININEYLGGIAATHGGNEIIIISAGYLGSLFFGLLLFYSSYDKNVSLWFCTALSILLLIFAANFLTTSLGKTFAVAIAALLIISPRYFNEIIHQTWIRIIGILSSIYVLIDIKEDLLTKNGYQTDTVMLEAFTGIPSYITGIAWFTVTLIALFFIGKKLVNTN